MVTFAAFVCVYRVSFRCLISTYFAGVQCLLFGFVKVFFLIRIGYLY